MAQRHVVTIDRSGRLVVPKSLRDELGLVPGQPLAASVVDGRLEIEPVVHEARIVERDGIHVIVPLDEVEPLTSDSVRDVLESVRR